MFYSLFYDLFLVFLLSSTAYLHLCSLFLIIPITPLTFVVLYLLSLLFPYKPFFVSHNFISSLFYGLCFIISNLRIDRKH